LKNISLWPYNFIGINPDGQGVEPLVRKRERLAICGRGIRLDKVKALFKLKVFVSLSY